MLILYHDPQYHTPFLFSAVPEVRGFEADIVFLADASSSVSQSEFKAQKDAVKELSRLLNADSGKSKVSFVTYSNRPIVVCKFEDCKDHSELARIIDASPLTGGSRRMDKALDQAWDLFNQRQNKRVPKITVLMTTGTHTSELNVPSLDKKASSMLSIGARIYVVAFGKRPDSRELSRAVQTSEDIVRIYSLEEVLSHMIPMANKIIKDRKYWS